MIRLIRSTSTVYGVAPGHRERLDLDFGRWGFRVYGVKGDTSTGEEVAPASISARWRHVVAGHIARFMASREIDREEGEAFLDALYAEQAPDVCRMQRQGHPRALSAFDRLQVDRQQTIADHVVYPSSQTGQHTDVRPNGGGRVWTGQGRHT